MESLLFLAHRIPYPPNKGDKIRSWNFLKYLSKKYNVYLGAFIDDPNDWVHVKELVDVCEETCIFGLNKKTKKIKSLTALLSGNALSMPYYADARMTEWVKKIIQRQKIKNIFIYSSQMAQYVIDDSYADANRVIDYVDVDSDKWRQYGESHSGPLGWIYRREGKRLFDYEKEVIGKFNSGIFVSRDEAELFKSMARNHADKILFISNGVNSEYFNPYNDYINPYAHDDKVLVFTGAMDYWANVDAVKWFTREVFISVSKLCPATKFFIVGSNPDKAVQELAAINNVYVTGSVDDVRPYIRHATAAVAPLRIARGLQNKVLEAMSMAKPIIATPMAMEGINAGDRLIDVCDTESEFIEKACEILTTSDKDDLNHGAREYIEKKFSWESNLKQLGGLFP